LGRTAGANEPGRLALLRREFVLEGLYAHRRICRSEEDAGRSEPVKKQGLLINTFTLASDKG